jgi:uncharacterized heparinase superfamily protein
MMQSLARYWWTLRYLRPVQIYGRALYRWYRPTVDARPAPPRRPLARGGWVTPIAHAASLVASSRFSFLGTTAELDDHGWDDPRQDKLWRYNLHYFGDLTSVDASARQGWHAALIDRWVRENPPASGTAWESYPTSLRIVNWVKWALAGHELPPRAEQSLAIQTRWLARRLERHLLGNHLLANAKALLFAGAWFAGPEASDWIALGNRILTAELTEQILEDGGHFERSTMYHALALEDVLDLVNLGRCLDPPGARAAGSSLVACRARVGAMRDWLAAMTHPDGEIAFFNDAAFGIAAVPAALDAYAERLGFRGPRPAPDGLTTLRSSGYTRMSRGSAVVIVDHAPVGPDYLPGHAHADTLSFELSLFGTRVLVNSGTSRYGADPERLRQRGTAAHNTVIIDDADSSEVWSGFRVARRARPFGLVVDDRGDPTVSCAHDGYHRLPGRPSHRRTLTLAADSLEICDEITGDFRKAEARLHLHPAVRVEPPSQGGASASSITLHLPDGSRVAVTGDGTTWRVDRATWHPAFGASEATTCLVAAFTTRTLRATVRWAAR